MLTMGKLGPVRLATEENVRRMQQGWTMHLGESLSSIAARRSDERGSFVRLPMARQLKLRRAKKKKS